MQTPTTLPSQSRGAVWPSWSERCCPSPCSPPPVAATTPQRRRQLQPDRRHLREATAPRSAARSTLARRQLPHRRPGHRPRPRAPVLRRQPREPVRHRLRQDLHRDQPHPGTHEIEAVVAHADHSTTNAHSQPITVTVSNSAAASGATGRRPPPTMATEVARPVIPQQPADPPPPPSSVVTLVLLFTGWWLLSGHEGRPSVLARLVDEPDVELHRQAGPGPSGLRRGGGDARGACVHLRAGDAPDRPRRRPPGWPASARGPHRALPRHRGHFDPGQRIANIAFVATLGTLIGTGIGLTTVHGADLRGGWTTSPPRHLRAGRAGRRPCAGRHRCPAGLPGGGGPRLGGRVPAARRLWRRRRASTRPARRRTRATSRSSTRSRPPGAGACRRRPTRRGPCDDGHGDRPDGRVGPRVVVAVLGRRLVLGESGGGRIGRGGGRGRGRPGPWWPGWCLRRRARGRAPGRGSGALPRLRASRRSSGRPCRCRRSGPP